MIAKNSISNLYWNGQAFAGSKAEAQSLAPSQLAFLRATYENVEGESLATEVIFEVEATHWLQGDFGEGFATYACLNGRWYSVNGRKGFVSDIRWAVRREDVLRALEM